MDTNNYIDGFVFPIEKKHLEAYKQAAEKIAEIWKEYGALAYFEYIEDDLTLEGVKSFSATLEVKEYETVIFGWVVFPSKEVRNHANKMVPLDTRIAQLVTPLTNPNKLIFDASRMVYGGFKAFISKD
ncbi:DUF1428 domain-containing protein [Neptunitalea lumnitzerae]|uniref:RNA signal recognition particle n=1 Tax=Neptunitalea lumnitzerae TaxID=2965509 RepID=A0ABQ5MF90_9FLAO|nr:DUF1428 domain-containing protein [Neptunitalea sp. Y10]GLB47705.1 RNA signal recognition particle [Neptunitalea sp. Y10]